MYERFTDRAQKVMQLANKEAQRFNHEYIGTEHILLGLIGVGGGAAVWAIKNHGIDLRKIRLEVEKLMQCGPDENTPATMGKSHQTPRAKRVIKYSMEEARTLNHIYIGTEHILLGLLREQEGVAAQVLMNLGLKLEDVREEVLNLLGCEDKVEEAMKTMPLNKIEAAMDLAENAETGESGDVTLTGDPPEEPLADVLERVDDPLYDLVDAIEPLVENSADTQAEAVVRITQMVQVVRLHERQQNETIKNMKETIRVMREESTKVRTESDAAIEGSLAKILECVIGHIDLMLDPLSTQDTLLTAGRATKHLCRQMINLAQLSTHVKESKAASAPCCKPQTTPPDEPQIQAIAAGLKAVDRAIPTTETPTDADKA